MDAKRWITMFALFLLTASAACAPAAATPARIAQEAKPARQSAPVEKPQAPAYAAPAMPAAPAEDNQFQDYGVNPETKSRYDHLSTFALDVDTASYSVTRKYLDEGNLPPYDSVRVEEFVNSFDQGYDARSDAAFTIYADGAPAPQGFETGEYVLRFGIQGYRVNNFERKPSVLTFVLDVSGSMSMENRLELVKDALRLLVNRLDERDSVAIVVYGTTARTVLNPTNGSQRGVIIDAIQRLRPEGSTNAEAGLRLGYKLAAHTYREGANNRVVLCSDGVANVGRTDSDSILNMVGGYVSDGIYLTTIGVGMGNFNDVLLEQLADKGNGNYAYINDMDEARTLFIDKLTSTLQVIAKDAKVQVDFNSDVVASYRLLGYENRAIADQDFRNDSVDAGELGAGHTATAVYSIRLKPGSQGRIATVQLRWQDPDNGEVKEINGNFNTWNMARSFEDGDPHFQLTVTAAQFAEILRQSPYAYEISLDDLAWRAERIAAMIEDENGQAGELARLIRKAASLHE